MSSVTVGTGSECPSKLLNGLGDSMPEFDKNSYDETEFTV
jgi:hypothetical protein